MGLSDPTLCCQSSPSNPARGLVTECLAAIANPEVWDWVGGLPQAFAISGKLRKSTARRDSAPDHAGLSLPAKRYPEAGLLLLSLPSPSHAQGRLRFVKSTPQKAASQRGSPSKGPRPLPWPTLKSQVPAQHKARGSPSRHPTSSAASPSPPAKHPCSAGLTPARESGVR